MIRWIKRRLFNRNFVVRNFSARISVVFNNCDYEVSHLLTVDGELMTADSIVIRTDSLQVGGFHLFHSAISRMEIVFDDGKKFEVNPTGCERTGEGWKLTLTPKNGKTSTRS